MQIAPDTFCRIRTEATSVRPSGCATRDPQGVHRVAQEFESLLISQLLKSMNAAGLGEEGEGANGSVMQYAQESMARALSQRGGIGIAGVVERALTQQAQAQPPAVLTPSTGLRK